MSGIHESIKQRLPHDLIQRVRIATMCFCVVMLIMPVPYVATSLEQGSSLLRVLLLVLYGITIWRWHAWIRGRHTSAGDLIVESLSVFLTAMFIDNPTIAVCVLYAGMLYRPFFSSIPHLLVAMGAYIVAFLAGVAVPTAGEYGLTSPEILMQPVTVLLAGGFVSYFASILVKQSQLLVQVHAGEYRYRSLVESIPGAIVTMSADGHLRYASPQVEALVSCPIDELPRDTATLIQRFVHPDDWQRVGEHVGLSMAAAQPFSIECRAVTATLQTIWVHVQGSLVCDGSDDAPFWQMIVMDVTERHALTEQLTHQAFHDALTGLPNRSLFMDRVGHALARAERRATDLAVCFVDLDNFKVINDSLGHDAGDLLVIETALRLRGAIRAGDTVARLGGDEFAILLEDIDNEAEAIEIVRRVLERAAEPCEVDGHQVYTTASIGIAFAGARKIDGQSLVRHADVAMYAAKQHGKSCYRVFEPEMEGRANERLEVESALRAAIERSEFRVVYQPIIDLATGAIREVEALVRWQHPTRGLLAPDAFLAIAEETGLIVPIGRRLMAEACRQTRAWQRACPEHANLIVSVNLSPRELLDQELADAVAAILEETQLAPQHLQLEVTENAMLSDVKRALSALLRLNGLGVRIAIDDFGTGNSSLGHLRELPVQTLKIDRSYVAELDRGSQDTTMLHAMVTLAKTLGMEVTAEGIETIEQTRLHELGCDYGQGYYFARPLGGADMQALLATEPRYLLSADRPALDHAA